MAKKRNQYTDEQLLGATPEPEGVLSKAKSIGLSGLSYIGNFFGTPGAVVKNAMAGKNPLTPILHPLSGEGRVEGRDLLRQAGLVGRKDTWGNWAAGLGVDIVTDPLTYINPLGFATKLGAITKAGKVAHAAGALDDVTKAATAIGRKSGRIGADATVGRASARARTTLGELLDFGDDSLKVERQAAARNAAQKMGYNFDELLSQPLGGVANWWVPGVGSGTLGASKAGAEFLEGAGKVASMIPGARGAAAAGSAVKRTVKGLFHGPSGGRFDKYGQIISELASEKMPAARRTVVQQSLGFWDRFKQVDEEFRKAFKPDAAPQPTGTSPFSEGDLVQAADRGNYGYVQSVADDGAEVHFTNPETGATATVKMPFAQLTKANSADLPESLRAQHDPVARVFDRILRMTAETRGDADAAIEKFAKGSSVPPALRDDIAKLAADAVEAKDVLWQQNLELGGRGRVLGESEDFQHFPRYLSKRGTGPLDTFRQLPIGHDSVAGRQDILRNLRADQIEDLRMNPKYRGEGAFANIFGDFYDSLGYQAKEGVVEPARHAKELVEYVAESSLDAVEKQKRLFDNMTFRDLGQYLLQGHKRNASLRAIHEAFHMNLSEQGAKLEDAFKFAGLDKDAAMEHFEKLSGLAPEQLANARVPPELANAAAAVVKTYENPEWSNLVTKTLDTVNRYFKPAMVLVKPSFWFRNHTSGQYANLVSGYIQSPADIADYMRSYKEVNQLWRAKDKAFERELEIMGILGADSTLEAQQHIYSGAMPKHDALPPNPLNVRQTAGEVESKLTADPTGIFGKSIKGVRKGAGTWMETNAKANRVVEYHNRASLYRYLKGKGYSPEQAAKVVNEVHYDYSTHAMAPFERDVMRRVVPFYCVPDDTTILTKDGWKTCDDLMVGDIALTYSLDGDCLEWQPVEEVAIFEHNQALMTIENKRHKIRCTPNHRWAVRQTYKSRRHIKEARELKTQDAIIVASSLPPGGESSLSVESARLLGWLLTDGYWRWRGKHLEAVIYQHPKKKTYQAAVSSAGGKIRTPHHNGTTAIHVTQERLEPIRHLMNRSKKLDHWIDVVNGLSREAAEAMYEAMYFGDGTTSDNHTNDHLACQLDGVAETFLVLATLLGKRVVRNSHGIYISHRTVLKTSDCEKSAEFYKGRVWCPRTANGTWVMRQGNLITITGNTFSRNNLPWTVERLLTSPGGPMAQTIKSLAREHRNEDLSPEYLSETASIPLSDLPDGSRRYLTGLGLGFEDPAGFATPSIKQVGLEAISRTNPLIKGPLEYMFGRSAFQKGPRGGRELEDLDPALGRTLANIGQITGLRSGTDPVRYPASGLVEHMLSNSPLAGVATSVRTITDPRKSPLAKAVNLTSGVHLTDVSPAAMDRELRSRVARVQKEMGGRQFVDAYIPKETLAAMTPEQRAEADRLNALKRLLDERSKKRKTTK